MTSEGSRATRFQPGRSGNPKGRPSGSRARTLAALDRLGDDTAEVILARMIDEAKGGDVSAARAILNRGWPASKGARVEFELPQQGAGDGRARDTHRGLGGNDGRDMSGTLAAGLAALEAKKRKPWSSAS